MGVFYNSPQNAGIVAALADEKMFNRFVHQSVIDIQSSAKLALNILGFAYDSSNALNSDERQIITAYLNYVVYECQS